MIVVHLRLDPQSVGVSHRKAWTEAPGGSLRAPHVSALTYAEQERSSLRL